MRLRTFHPHQPAAKINVTPLIDVVMVLIIFYLIVGKLAADKRSRVDLPESRIGATSEEQKPVVITVTAEGASGSLDLTSRILLDGVEVPRDALADALRARVGDKAATTTVQVRADRRLSYGAVEPVVKACRAAGLTAVWLVTEKSGGA
ncbi:MAG TPA: biopolymer transporter ExbD [Phycisphaerales bacterium]|nr:biopolymer transporter ExbD [Phycisphaerales bacterium]